MGTNRIERKAMNENKKPTKQAIQQIFKEINVQYGPTLKDLAAGETPEKDESEEQERD